MQDISLEQAAAVLLSHAKEPAGKEQLPLLDALGRVAAEDISAPLDHPPFDRSPLDGYAVRAVDTAHASKEHPAMLRIIGEECAGDFLDDEVHPGEAVRIMTGAAMPRGTDAVVRQEDAAADDTRLWVPYALHPHENYCFRGEDVKAGTCLLRRGTSLRAAHISVLAAQGFTTVTVWKKPRIAIASTGDELSFPGETLMPGKIYNSNLYLLAGRIKELGLTPVVCGNLPDDAERAADILRRHSGADLLITTGGVSVGKKDIMHTVWKELGAERLFWRVRMKPGAPLLAYRRGATLGIALSGNPFAAYATFELLVRPVLAKLSGKSQLFPQRCRAVLANDFPKESQGRRFIRAFHENGRLHLPEFHASGAFFSAAECNALVDIPAGTGKLAAGCEVDAVLL